MMKTGKGKEMLAIRAPVSRAVVGAILTLAHTLGLRVVTEGVERRSQFEIVRRLGADLVQGYLISRPLPANSVVKLFDSTCPW